MIHCVRARFDTLKEKGKTIWMIVYFLTREEYREQKRVISAVTGARVWNFLSHSGMNQVSGKRNFSALAKMGFIAR